MARKLYPSLEEFYNFHNNNFENGDEDIWYSVSDQKLYRTKKRAKNYKDIADSILPHRNITEEGSVTQCTPSAPPMEEISWEELADLECYPDYSLLRDGTLPPPYSDHDPLIDNAWVDDLQPDYDDDNSTQTESIIMNISVPVVDNSPSDSSRNRNTDHHRKIGSNLQKLRNAGPQRSTDNNGRRVYESHHGPPHGNNDERNVDDYTAWVSWRKQVNRQLAALILLRRGEHVRLQTVDLSRKPLSKTSMREVFQKATHDCDRDAMTSLNGKPYIMYGIPRAALTRSPTKQ